MSRNVVYAIRCKRCNKAYIGESGRRLGDRFVEHLRSVEQDDGKPVSKHFNGPSHVGVADMEVFVLRFCHGTKTSRQTLASRLIHKLGTISPQGMNTKVDLP